MKLNRFVSIRNIRLYLLSGADPCHETSRKRRNINAPKVIGTDLPDVHLYEITEKNECVEYILLFFFCCRIKHTLDLKSRFNKPHHNKADKIKEVDQSAGIGGWG